MRELSEQCEPLVRHRNDTDIGVDRAERIVRGFRSGTGQGIEQCALAYVREAYYA